MLYFDPNGVKASETSIATVVHIAVAVDMVLD